MTNDATRDQLEEFGLTKSEISIYMFLLEYGLATPPQIAKGTGIARTNTYNVLHSLLSQQLVEEQAMGKRKAYTATDPSILLAREEKKRHALKKLLPTLRGLHISQKNKPRVKYFDTIEGIHSVYEQSLQAKKIFGVGSTKKLFARSPAFFDLYEKRVKEKGIEFYDILTAASMQQAAWITLRRMGDTYHVKGLPPQYEDIGTAILLWDNTVALMTIEDPVFATVLTDTSIARTFMTIFDVLWASLEKHR